MLIHLSSPEIHDALLQNKCIYMLELNIGFESSNLLLSSNATGKSKKYQELINEQHKNSEKVKFVNTSISSLGVFSESSLGLIEMLKDPKFDERCRKYCVRKIINLICSYVSGLRYLVLHNLSSIIVCIYH
jgi:hypothetical protein